MRFGFARPWKALWLSTAVAGSILAPVWLLGVSPDQPQSASAASASGLTLMRAAPPAHRTRNRRAEAPSTAPAGVRLPAAPRPVLRHRSPVTHKLPPAKSSRRLHAGGAPVPAPAPKPSPAPQPRPTPTLNPSPAPPVPVQPSEPASTALAASRTANGSGTPEAGGTPIPPQPSLGSGDSKKGNRGKHGKQAKPHGKQDSRNTDAKQHGKQKRQNAEAKGAAKPKNPSSAPVADSGSAGSRSTSANGQGSQSGPDAHTDQGNPNGGGDDTSAAGGKGNDKGGGNGNGNGGDSDKGNGGGNGKGNGGGKGKT